MMKTSEAVFPIAERYVLRNARLPASVVETTKPISPASDGLVSTDMLIDAGKIADFGTQFLEDIPSFDLDGASFGRVALSFTPHLDKGHIWPRTQNPDGTVFGAVEAVRQDREANWSEQDVARRFEFSLRCAYAHGTSSIRTHIDSYGDQAPISWPVFTRLREEWARRINLQAVALTTLDVYEGEAGRDLANRVFNAQGVLGAVTKIADPPQAQRVERIAAALDRLFQFAAERGLDVDLHVDETEQLEPDTLKEAGRAVLRNRFQGRVVCGHCCSLALRSEADARETMALFARPVSALLPCRW